ncbi:MAG: hypothetical protein HY735_14590 [Verrucomicrobia bacterium]|nr:hypothetical protein [Verrucomicrobiota bacterium]
MKKVTRHFVVVALASMLIAFPAPAAESLSVLLQKGIYAEETEGNLDAAIKIYEEIVNAADANPERDLHRFSPRGRRLFDRRGSSDPS